MKLKTLVLCVAILAVLSGAAYFLNRPEAPPATDPRVGQRIVDTAIATATAHLAISDQGKTVKLSRQPDGTWTVDSYFGLTADFPRISRLIGDLNEAKIDRLVTTNPDRIARLEFKDSSIRLSDASDKVLLDLQLGKSPPIGTGKFIRFGTEQKAFVSGLSVYLDADSKSWADAQLVNLKPEDVASVSIQLEKGGTVVASHKKKDDPWTATGGPGARKFKPDSVQPILSSLGSLRFSDTVATDDPAAAAAAPFMRSFVLTTFDGKTLSIEIGRKPEEKKIKPPVADAKSGPASLGKASDLKAGSAATDAAKPGEAKPGEPEFETIPAGPVFVKIRSSDAHAPVNALMAKRAFQVDEYVYTGLPKGVDDLFEAPPAPPAPPASDGKPSALSPAGATGAPAASEVKASAPSSAATPAGAPDAPAAPAPAAGPAAKP